CPGTNHNTLKFIDLNQARFSVDESERSRTDSRLLDSSVDHPTICRRSGIDVTRPVLRCGSYRLGCEAVLCQPENLPPADTTMILRCTAGGGNLASIPLRATARALSPEGYAAFSISTGQRDEHVNTDRSSMPAPCDSP